MATAISLPPAVTFSMKRPVHDHSAALPRALQNGGTFGGGPAQLPANDGTEIKESNDLGALWHRLK
jgi:hypothetical protein